MNVVHALWIPEAGHEFVRGGAFHLWVESAESLPHALPNHHHPRSLSGEGLNAFLEQLGIPPVFWGLDECFLALPSGAGGPLPSPELLPHVEMIMSDFDGEYQTWTVAAARLTRQPIATLNELHFQAVFQGQSVRLGADFLFWYWFTQSLKAILFKDSYIPGLRLRRVPKGEDEIFGAWEIVSPAYESLLADGAVRMPRCAAPEYEPHSLLRHCAEVLLHRGLGQTRLTQSLAKKIEGSVVEAAFGGTAGRPWAILKDPAIYHRWYRWRGKLTDGARGSGIHVCFQLHEADAEAPNVWRLTFLVAARQDPSLRWSLADYWAMDEQERAALGAILGNDFQQALLLKLGQAARIYPRLWTGMETDQPTGIALQLEEAFHFLNETAWVLEDAGFSLIVPAWWTPQGRRRAKLRLRSSAGAKKIAASSGKNSLSLKQLLNYRYELTLDGQSVEAAEWERLIEAKTPLVQFRGRWVALDRERMREMLNFWKTRGDEGESLDAAELLRRSAEDDDLFELDPEDAFAAMLAPLREHHRLRAIEEPEGLRAHLRDYQRRGVAWLSLLEELGLGACLADDMGLGKTMQVIARMLLERSEQSSSAPSLLIAPTSVIGNWRKEIERFAPELRSAIHHDAGRSRDEASLRETCEGLDVLITSYSLVRMDAKLFAALPWRRIVLDEAQNIKNPLAAQTKAILQIKAESRVALTGTPVENRLLDLWSIFNFINPGYLGRQAQFRKNYELPIQKENNQMKANLLRRLVEPFVLRRVKTDPAIIRDLPDKVESRQYCNLSREQASLYEAVVRDVERQLEESEGIQRQGLMLSTLMKLKQVCNHPAQFLQDGTPFSPERSHKLQRLLEMLEEVVAGGESALVFTQFVEIGGPLEREIRRQLQCRTFYLHGGTSQRRRDEMIEHFQEPEGPPSVFVLSLKAGGVGITLTRANHVFHFDRWWNPAVEDQATDRAFRIGQSRNVFVHKFVTEGTLEERIDQLIQDKRQIAGAIVGADESWLSKLDNESFRDLIALNRQTLVD